MKRNYIIAALILGFVIFPVVVIQFTLAKSEQGTDTPQYVFKARIREQLGETNTSVNVYDGVKITRYQYFLVETLDGTTPDTEFVILIVNQDVTRGYSNVKLDINQEFWGHGYLMDPDLYEHLGDEYIFFEHPQVQLYQVKGTLLWPDQIPPLKLLYQAPIARLTAPYYLWAFPQMDEFTTRNYVAFIIQTVLIIGTIVLAIKKREDKGTLVIILLAFILLTMVISSSVLPNPYWSNYDSQYFP